MHGSSVTSPNHARLQPCGLTCSRPSASVGRLRNAPRTAAGTRPIWRDGSLTHSSRPSRRRLNSLPKYVVSSTLDDPDWNNSTVLKGDVVNQVAKLKQEIDGDIVVPGSFQLLRTLMEHDLVDELRLKIFPVVLGAGERLFGETSDKKPMRLVASRSIDDGVAFLTYERVRDA